MHRSAHGTRGPVTDRRGTARLADGFTRSANWARVGGASCASERGVDGGNAGERSGDVAFSVCGAIHFLDRTATDALSGPLAHAGRGATPEGRPRQHRADSLRGGLRLRSGIQPCIQTRVRGITGHLASAGRMRLAVSITSAAACGATNCRSWVYDISSSRLRGSGMVSLASMRENGGAACESGASCRAMIPGGLPCPSPE